MRLLRDDYMDIYVWVDDNDETKELSPHFDYEEDADAWYIEMQRKFHQG